MRPAIVQALAAEAVAKASAPKPDRWHWLRHRWGLWEPYKQPFVNHDAPWTPSFIRREARRCLTCGASQDREVGR